MTTEIIYGPSQGTFQPLPLLYILDIPWFCCSWKDKASLDSYLYELELSKTLPSKTITQPRQTKITFKKFP